MAGVNGIEIKVGQVWRNGQGNKVCVGNRDSYNGLIRTHYEGEKSVVAYVDDNGVSQLGTYNLVELVKDENGFTIFTGQVFRDETLLKVRFADGSVSFFPTRADELPWGTPGKIVAYKVVEQATTPQPTDSATLAEETLLALGWTFDGQAWTEQPKAELRIDMVPNALDVQVGGTHYKDCAIQPIEYIHANKLGFAEGNVVKYITRHRQKHGADDVRKVIHYCQLLLELEYGAGKTEGGV